MDSYANSGFLLPDAVSNVIWRIVGNDESPLKRETTSRLIDRTIRKYAKHVPSAIQDNAIAEVRGWFEFHEKKGWLKEDMRESVAYLIVNAVRDNIVTQSGLGRSETAFCAVGSIEPGLAAKIINSSWSPENVEVFGNYAFKTLKDLCDRDAVLDPERIMRLGIANAKASLKDTKSGERLETLWRMMEDFDWWLHSCVANMIELLVKLNPDHFYTIVEGLSHPVIHLQAARCVTEQHAPSEHCVPLQWLTNTSTDDLVALAIVHILASVDTLDSDLRWGNERERDQDKLDPTATRLLSDLVDLLGNLEPAMRARWVVELLSYGIFALHAQGGNEKPPRIEQLEELCSHQLKRLVQESWSEELSNELRVGLCLTPLTPRILPLAQVALEMREELPVRSAEIARLILDTHEQQISAKLDGMDSFFYDLGYWTNSDWVKGLGIALALSDGELDVPEWVSGKCRALPLSVWDAEEDFELFLKAEKVAQFRFLVALHAVQMLTDVDRAEDPEAALTLAEDLWSHCQFVGRHIMWQLQDSDVAEYAARVAVVLGKPSDDWVLDQAGNAGVGPRTLWALLDQAMADGARGLELRDDPASAVAELRRTVSSRFDDVRGLGPTELYYLGKLWLLLGGSTEAEETAMAIASLPEKKLSRPHKIIALELLAFAASERRLTQEAENRIASLYSELWGSYTPTEESVERQQVDDLLKG